MTMDSGRARKLARLFDKLADTHRARMAALAASAENVRRAKEDMFTAVDQMNFDAILLKRSLASRSSSFDKDVNVLTRKAGAEQQKLGRAMAVGRHLQQTAARARELEERAASEESLENWSDTTFAQVRLPQGK